MDSILARKIASTGSSPLLTATDIRPNIPAGQSCIMPDQVIGHYRILEKIGAGAMGEVFRARDEQLGRDVALKLIKPASNDNPDHRHRFELEARAAASLNHPNIVSIYDVGFHKGSPYIVSELLEGQTLRKRLSEGALPIRLAADYSSQIVQGLIAAHDRQITHRDLKPENLFLTNDGRVKILDFGVAKLQEDSERSVEELTTVTRAGTLVGTPPYMSPEQLRGERVDHRSDIFSFGTILYEMLTGHRAYKGETEGMIAVAQERPLEIDLEQAGIPVTIRHIVDHCLEKEPENRFQSARDLAFALDTLSDALGGRLKHLRVRGWQMTTFVILPWAAVAGVLLVASLWLLFRPSPPSPTYQRLTFEHGTIYSARFSPDGRSFVYGAAWNGQPLRLFSAVGDSLLSQPLNFQDASLLAISNTRELALVLHGDRKVHLETANGTLASAPLAGGSPRELLEDVSWADWDPTRGNLAVADHLAVVHHAQGRDQIEYPIGHVLYQSNGWISHLRFSPQSDKIAFMDHPARWDDRGSVCLIDLRGIPRGTGRVLSQEWVSEDGLAWSPDGKEVWFTAAEEDTHRELRAVTLSGKVRKILALPASMTLEDVAPDGRVLVSLDDERLAMATTAKNGQTLDLSWHDWNIVRDISRDGQSVLFEDDSEIAGPNYAVAIRKIDGTPPVRLGAGSAGGLSPDGKWTFSVFTGHPQRVTLLPVGPGQSRQIEIGDLELQNDFAHFLPDGTAITVNANEPGHGVRCYVLDLNGGKPRPVTNEGIQGDLVSPDGRYILPMDTAAEVAVYPLDGGLPRVISGLEPGFIPVQWSKDSTSIYGYHPGKVPAEVYKVNIATGEKTLIQELRPETTAGAVTISNMAVTRDGSLFAYSYYQVFSVLYVISGLR